VSQPLIVSVPHRLGRQEARRRLDGGIGRLQRELGVLLGWLDYHWQGDTLNFIASECGTVSAAGSRCWTMLCAL
jgi:hypothetical protein